MHIDIKKKYNKPKLEFKNEEQQYKIYGSFKNYLKT